MANKLKYINDIEQGLVIESWHVSQSVEAFSSTNQQAYDISVSGSFNVTGSVSFEPNNINNQVRNYVLSFDDTTGRVFKMETGSIQDNDNEVYRTGSKNSNIIPSKFGTFDNQGTNSVISSGNNNKIDALIDNTFIGGGILNTASGDCSFIGAGQSLKITSSAGDTAFNSIIGGISNSIIDGSKSSIIGGSTNTIKSDTYNACNNLIGTAQCSLISGQYNFIGSGINNKISGSSAQFPLYSSIINGFTNHISSSSYTTITGGQNNRINGSGKSFIGGGSNQCIGNSAGSFIGGGCFHTISGTNTSTIVGGNNHCITSCCSFIRSEEHTSELQSRLHLVCRLLLEKKKKTTHM